MRIELTLSVLAGFAGGLAGALWAGIVSSALLARRPELSAAGWRPDTAWRVLHTAALYGLCGAAAGLLFWLGWGLVAFGETPGPTTILGALAVAELIAVLASRLAVARLGWARSLHRDFRALLGDVSSREIMILAVASSIGEEVLFRGALQPWLGLGPQAALFALLHVGPGRRFLPWTLWALVMGLVFGALVELTGDLGAPIVAHFTINFLNLHYIARVELPARPRLTPPALSEPLP